MAKKTIQKSRDRPSVAAFSCAPGAMPTAGFRVIFVDP
jgi:hypothetical protein